MFWYVSILRLVSAWFCGVIIGFERKNRSKKAGIKTHALVALGSALIMLISKYGFTDLLGDFYKADVSRVAANIVSGIGFLGAGMILVNKRKITGLTTAAGIWATAGIGMAIGAGMYLLGVSATLILLFTQIFVHSNYKIFKESQTRTIEIYDVTEKDFGNTLKQMLKPYNIQITDISINKKGQKSDYYVTGEFMNECTEEEILDLFYYDCFISSASE